MFTWVLLYLAGSLPGSVAIAGSGSLIHHGTLRRGGSLYVVVAIISKGSLGSGAAISGNGSLDYLCCYLY